MRQRIAAGNWKMFKTTREARDFFKEWETLVTAAAVKEGAALAKKSGEAVTSQPQTQTVFFPSAILLSTVADATADLNVQFGSQNTSWQQEGAFTGETSAFAAKEMGAAYALIGHSERRSLFGETDEIIAKKVAYADSVGLIPMLCVGETLQERESNHTERVVSTQLRLGLSLLPATTQSGRLPFVIAYEPVWAIGTGKVATPEQAEDVHTFLRSELKELRGAAVADLVPILYGGSVKPDNALVLSQRKNIDGFLVGGASLKPAEFLTIANTL